MYFHLLAPTMEKVELVGQWLDQELPMRLVEGQWMVEAEVPDGRWWYKFRLVSRSPFLSGQTVEVSDPLARLVENELSMVVVEDGRDVTTEYDWRFDEVALPGNRALTIYEAHVAEFGAQGQKLGRFVDVEARLDYLQQLGITALELMPVMWFPEEADWGYNTRFPCAVKDTYGTPQELKQLIDACHQRGMRVILDLVINHQEKYSPLTQVDFYYWYKDDPPGMAAFGPKFNYEYMDKRGVMPATVFQLTVARFWVEEYHIDGFRLDSAALVDNDDFLQRFYDQCHELVLDKPFYIVVEYLPENPAIVSVDGPADGAWHQEIEFEIMNALTGRGENTKSLYRSLLASNLGYALPMQVVNYVESHDEGRLVERLVSGGMDHDRAMQGATLAIVILATAVGNPMLFQGQEFGAANRHSTTVKPLEWSLLDKGEGATLQKMTGRLLEWSLHLPPMADDQISSVIIRPGLLVYRRGRGHIQIVVALNFKDEEVEVALPLSPGQWRELWSGEEIAVATKRQTIVVPGMGSKLFLFLDG